MRLQCYHALLCRHTACKYVPLAFAYIVERTVVNCSYEKLHILLFCDFTCVTFAVFIILEGMSNVYCCCYARTQTFGTEASLASAVEANFAPYI